jgi:hypothetical protein
MHLVKGLNCIFTLFLFVALHPAAVFAETLIESSIESRLYLAFQVQESELQSWLPEPWKVSPMTAGPSKGANLSVVFVQQLLSQTPEGKPFTFGRTARYVVLTVPAKHTQTGEESVLVTRVYMPDSDMIPGPFKNSVKAEVRREFTQKGENLAPGTGSDDWEMKEAGGGTIMVRFSYLHSGLNRVKWERKIRSSIDPNLHFIFQVDQSSELLRSVPGDVDRLQSYEFRSTVPELSKLLDGSAKLVSITAIPSYILQASSP